jgi:poly(3-hydroxybutyrate) depolymerase
MLIFPGRPKSDVAVSWQKGTAHVPGKLLTTSPDEIETDQPLPVVLYLHGCDGIGKTDRCWASFRKDLGFIVVQPDSMMTLPGHAHDSFEPQAKEALSGFLQEIAAQAPR